DPTRITGGSFRPDCANMLAMALADHGKSATDMTLSHRLEFDPKRLASYWGAKLVQYQLQAEQCRMLAQTPLALASGERFVFDLFNALRSDATKQDPDGPVGAGRRDIRNSVGYKTVLGLFAG